jgi:hypothetical protein
MNMIIQIINNTNTIQILGFQADSCSAVQHWPGYTLPRTVLYFIKDKTYLLSKKNAVIFT